MFVGIMLTADLMDIVISTSVGALRVTAGTIAGAECASRITWSVAMAYAGQLLEQGQIRAMNIVTVSVVIVMGEIIFGLRGQ